MSAVLRWSRSVAAVIGLGTGVNVVTSGMAANPGSSLFLVPDLLVAALLLAAAAAPAARAAPALLVAFGAATGVFATAAMSYALRGEVGWGVTAFAVITASLAVLLTLRAPPMIDTRSGCRTLPTPPGIV